MMKLFNRLIDFFDYVGAVVTFYAKRRNRKFCQGIAKKMSVYSDTLTFFGWNPLEYY